MLDPKEYTVGWICAIFTEYVAAQAFLDERHAEPGYLTGNKHEYTLGRIGKHNVAIAVLPDGEYGTASASRVADSMMYNFPNIRIALMVGIGGGAPTRKNDIRLGDIVVSSPSGGQGGVYQYDFGKAIQGKEFQATGFLNQPPELLRLAVSGLRARYESDGHQLEDAVNKAIEKKPRLRKKYSRPDPSSDRLYHSYVVHKDNQDQCDECGDDESRIVARKPREEDEDNPAIHYGLIASANRLMKDALVRDEFAREKNILCFEMEAAGLMNHFPCLVIRGICDYADSHKNDDWQGYAAMTAAAYAKDILYRIAPQNVEKEERVATVVNQVQGDQNVTMITFGADNYGLQVGSNTGSIHGAPLQSRR